VIILTGASGGIGKEILQYLLEFDQVIGIYNKTKPKVLTNKGLIYEQLNLESAADIKSFVDKWKDKLSKLTLVHFAASSIDSLAANYSEIDWDQVMNINLKGNFLLTQALLPLMISKRWGRIIHISSVVGMQGRAGTVAYSTSKSGLMGLSRVLAKEYARFNITSNVLVLGYFEVGLIDSLKDETKNGILNQIPSKSFGKVSNITNAIKFLINSEYVNGATINIDGGI
jgi:NAD(P)-dependent dehydrogenase (short-subunit alcohol dehydrogenase family)